jgi:hypothetical protein
MSVRAMLTSRSGKRIAVVAGLTLIVLANLYLRWKLDASPLPPYRIFPEDRVPWSWSLLLPRDMGDVTDDPAYKATYFWFTTGSTVIKVFHEVLSPNRTYYLMSALLIICSFAFSWLALRSLVFSFTLAICMGFGTQFHWLHVCSSLVAHLLLMIYFEANLLCAWKTIETGAARWKLAFAGSLIVTALCHEQWLDYFGFLLLAGGFLLLYARRAQLPHFTPRVLFVVIVNAIIGIIYLGIRLSYGQQQYRPGYEAEMIFMYQHPVVAVEDFLSNVMTYIYISFSTYFPPFMVSSNSLYTLGAAQLLEEQHGYHTPQTHLVVMHHVFYWYFWAGIVFAVFAYACWRSGKSALRDGSGAHAGLFLALLLVACGFAVHSVIKYRPYLSVPLLTYKCILSTLGVALVLSACLMRLRDWLPGWPRLRLGVILLAWGVILHGSVARPALLSHLSQVVGLSELPDPRRNLRLPRWLRAPAPSAPLPASIREAAQKTP